MTVVPAKNLSSGGIDLPGGWRLLPGKTGECVHQNGERVNGIPSDIAWHPKTLHLAQNGMLEIEGFSTKPKAGVPQPKMSEEEKAVANAQGTESSGSGSEGGSSFGGGGSGKRKRGR